MVAPDRIALDRASVRTIDQDGHLHVADSAISAAQVNGYYGHEIPEADALGLQPDRLYQLLRDPAEMERAAPTFDGKPLLIVHKAQTAADHDRSIVVGAVANVRWEAPCLRGELTVWDADGIAGINTRERCDLSAAYRYKAVMEPGTYEGTPYDGRMTEIFGNHVALVAEGRVDGAVVGDAKPKETRTMAKAKLSRQAVYASGALTGYLKPKLAADAKVDVAALLKDVTAKTWKADKPRVKLALDAAVAGKLAKDADIADVVDMLDQLEEMVDEVEPAGVEPAAEDEEAETEEEKKARLAKRAADKAAKDEADKEKDKDKVDKPAMDAAIAAAVDKARRETEASTIARINGIHAAKEAVRPHVGEVIIAADSAEAVYGKALELNGHDVTGIDPSAFAAMVKMLPRPGATPAVPRMGLDAANRNKFDEMFPTAGAIKIR